MPLLPSSTKSEVHNIIIALPQNKDRVTTTGNTYRTCGEILTCDF